MKYAIYAAPAALCFVAGLLVGHAQAHAQDAAPTEPSAACPPCPPPCPSSPEVQRAIEEAKSKIKAANAPPKQ